MSVTVTDNSPFQDYPHPDDHTTQSTVTPRFKPFTVVIMQLEITWYSFQLMGSSLILGVSTLVMTSITVITQLERTWYSFQFFMTDASVMSDADWRRSFLAPFFACMCNSWRKQSALMVLRSVMFKNGNKKSNGGYFFTKQRE